MLDIYLATSNLNKLKEYEELFTGLNVKLHLQAELKQSIHVEENGNTFYENAKIKANTLAEIVKDALILADDSGLIIHALPDILNVRTARYLAEYPYSKRCQSVIDLLKSQNDDSAMFVCSIVVIDHGKEKHFEGICKGKISPVLTKGEGFGYDPIFIPEGYTKTFAQLGESLKNQISHRGIAFSKLLNYLRMEHYEDIIK